MCHEWYDEFELAELLRLGERQADKLTQTSRTSAPKHEPAKEQEADRKPLKQPDAIPA